MLKGIRGIEVAAGWLAVISGAALAFMIWQGGFIAPESTIVDLVVFGFILLLVAVGVTLDALAPTWAVRTVALSLLTIGVLALTFIFVISFIIELGIPVLLAIIATVLAYVRLASSEAPQPAR